MENVNRTNETETENAINLEALGEVSAKDIKEALSLGGGKGRAKGAISNCKICGRAASRDSGKVNEASPNHLAAKRKDLPTQVKKVEHILLMNEEGKQKLDFIKRKQFQKWLENAKQVLAVARTEHDAYAVEQEKLYAQSSASDKSRITHILHLCALKLGVTLNPKMPGEDEVGEVIEVDASPLNLAEQFQAHLLAYLGKNTETTTETTGEAA
jgi:hypothetical protein